MEFDYLVIGAGLSGATFAQQAHEKGKSVLVVDKRPHVGGNCYTELRDGIHIHMYGGHIWHCNDDGLWNYINRFAKMRQYEHRVKVRYKDRIYSFPINSQTLYEVYGTMNLLPITIYEDNSNLENWCIGRIGPELYEIFIEGYTTKQWGRHPRHLPSSIIKRIPIRTSWDDRYFNDKYQGIPEDGYTSLIANMLDGIQVELGMDYFNEREMLDGIAKQVIYTGPIDTYFGCSFGPLEYRSLRHEHKFLPRDYQGCATVNYTDAGVPYTRIMEWKYFGHLADHMPHSWITTEYPQEYNGTNEPFYPISDDRNMAIYKKYKSMAESIKGVHFMGRLATYQYFDMHQVVAQALKKADEIL